MAVYGRIVHSKLFKGSGHCLKCSAMRWNSSVFSTFHRSIHCTSSGLQGLHGEKGTRQWASNFVHQLTDRERIHLRDAMRCYEMQNGGEKVERLTKHQFRHVLIYNALPFIGFGFLDNAIMICAGEYIDYTFGTLLSISTMAAAALGNLVSDLFGVGLAGYVELLATRVGISVPDITPAQHDSREARWASAAGRAIGVSIGCIIGMFPLLLFDDEKEDDEESCSHPDHKTPPIDEQSTKT